MRHFLVALVQVKGLFRAVWKGVTRVFDELPHGRSRYRHPSAQPGPCVLAVRADVAAWGVGSEHALVAAAEAMARILDDPRQVTTQPPACGKLLQIMAELREHAAPRRSRLAVVQEMSKPSRPDAG